MKLIRIKTTDYRKEFYFDLDRIINGETFCKVSFFPQDGGVNYATSKIEQKGYYVSVKAVTLEKFLEGYTERSSFFGGLKMLIKTINRKSIKGFNNCIKELLEYNFKSLCNQTEYDLTNSEIEFMYQKLIENWE